MLSSGVDPFSDAWEEMAMCSGMIKPVLYRPSGPFAPMEGGAPYVADLGLSGVVCSGTEPEVLSMACDSSL